MMNKKPLDIFIGNVQQRGETKRIEIRAKKANNKSTRTVNTSSMLENG